MHFSLVAGLVLLYAKWAYSNYYILDSFPGYLSCYGEVSRIAVPHITLCAMWCFKRNCKFYEYVDGVCHMKGDWVPLPRGSFHHLYKPRLNNLTNVAPNKPSEGSDYDILNYDSNGVKETIKYGAWCGVDCYSGCQVKTKVLANPWWRVDLTKVYNVHSINILPDPDFIQEFKDITVYISTDYGSGEDDFSGFTFLTKYPGPYNVNPGWFNYSMSPPMAIQYIGIKRTTSSGKLVLKEVEVIGEEDSPVV